MLARQGKHADAARIFESAGDLAASREQHQLAGDWKAAAIAALNLGSYFEGGKELFDHGDYARAVDALQQVRPEHVGFREASSLLGRCFETLKDLDMARRMHSRAVSGIPMSRENLDLFYQFARFLEGSADPSDHARAKQVYAEILAIQYTFRDVKSRHDRLN
jgi:tetratricopeptide (TPR) repeat protein